MRFPLINLRQLHSLLVQEFQTYQTSPDKLEVRNQTVSDHFNR